MSAGQEVATRDPRAMSIHPSERRPTMAKAMTKSEIATQLAEKAGISKKQVNQILEAQADLAYRQAKNQFPIPGIGKLVLVERPARTMIMQFGPKKGQTINVPKKKVLKFRIAKAAKDAVLGAKK
jgi:DNA-binding protein HU-beta